MSPAVAVPVEQLKWDYATLSSKTKSFAAGLRAIGFQQGDVIVSDLPNTQHNLLLQLACAHIGVAVATSKDSSALSELCKTVNVKGAITATRASFLCSEAFPLPAMIAGESDAEGPLNMESVIVSGEGLATAEAIGDGAAAAAYFNSASHCPSMR